MPELPLVTSCSLDENGLRRQLARYRQAGAGARVIERSPRRLAVALDATVDPALIEQAIATERECCPFFELRWDPAARLLAISVAQREHEPALDAIAYALDV
jgi:hypothetical protein